MGKPKQQQLENFKLTPKQALFVLEYLKDFNATQAAIRAGYSADTAQKNAHRLMAIDGIAKEIKAATAKRLESAELSAARVLEEYRRIAFVNIKDFHDEHGNIKPIQEWSEDMGAAVAATETILKNVAAGDGIVDRLYKLKLWDKLKALQDLAKYFGLLVDRVEVSGELELISRRLAEARQRAAKKGAA